MSLRWDAPGTNGGGDGAAKLRTKVTRQARLRGSLEKIAATMQARTTAAAEREARRRGWGSQAARDLAGGYGGAPVAESRPTAELVESPESYRPARKVIGPVQDLPPEEEQSEIPFLTRGLGSTVSQCIAYQGLTSAAAQPSSLDGTTGGRMKAESLTSIVLGTEGPELRDRRETTPAGTAGTALTPWVNSDDLVGADISELPSVLGASAFLPSYALSEHESEEFDEFGSTEGLISPPLGTSAVAGMERTMQRLELAQTVDDAVDVPVTLNEGGKVEAEKVIYSNIQDGAPGLALRGMQLARLPALLLQASHLVELDTSYNNLTRVPNLLETLTFLRSLNLGHNQLTALHEGFRVPTNLKALNLEHIRLSALPPQICLLTGLRELTLRHNDFEELPRHLGMLEVLEDLDCSCNRLSGLPRSLFLLNQLRRLDLSSNYFADLPPTFCQLRRLQSLDLSSNRLQSWPPALLQLGPLQKLSLRDNLIECIPPEVQHVQLRELCVAGNRLRALPAELCAVTSLEALDLSRNKLTALPECLSRLANLRSLNAVDNICGRYLRGWASSGACSCLRWRATGSGKSPRPSLRWRRSGSTPWSRPGPPVTERSPAPPPRRGQRQRRLRACPGRPAAGGTPPRPERRRRRPASWTATPSSGAPSRSPAGGDAGRLRRRRARARPVEKKVRLHVSRLSPPARPAGNMGSPIRGGRQEGGRGGGAGGGGAQER